jgi:signal transduction histidine kinase
VEDALKRESALMQQAQRAALLGQLVGGFVHDFNNLLSVINGCSELMLGGQGSPRELAAEIHRAGTRAAAFARQLLSVGHARPGARPLVDVNAVIRDMTPLLQRLLGKDIKLVTLLDAAVRLARADAGEFEQVLLNLAINARAVMPQGGLVTIETANVEVAWGADPAYPKLAPGAYVMMAVVDTGHGIAPEIKARLFEPFFTTKAPGVGTGLGLATVQRIVHSHGGAVTVESEPGCGACFKVFLPRVQGVAHEDALAKEDSVHDLDTVHEGRQPGRPKGW